MTSSWRTALLSARIAAGWIIVLMRRLLLPLLFVAMAATCAEAKPRACTNSELQAGLTDNMILGCTRKNGSVKCDSDGTILCCRNIPGGGQVCVSESNLNLLKPPAPTKPPAAKGETAPGKVKP